MLFLPELFLLGASLVLFFITLGEDKGTLAKNFTIGTGLVLSILCAVGINQSGTMFYGAYAINFYSQFFKLYPLMRAHVIIFTHLSCSLSWVRFINKQSSQILDG